MKPAARIPESDPNPSLIDKARLWLAKIISPPPKNPRSPRIQKESAAPPLDFDWPDSDAPVTQTPDLFSTQPPTHPPDNVIGAFDLPPADRIAKPNLPEPALNLEPPAPPIPATGLKRAVFDQVKADKAFKSAQNLWSAILGKGLEEAGMSHQFNERMIFDALVVSTVSLLTLHLPASYVADLCALMLEDLDANRLPDRPAARFESSYELGRVFALALESADAQAELRGASHKAKIEAFHFGLVDYGSAHYSPDVLTRILDELERIRRRPER